MSARGTRVLRAWVVLLLPLLSLSVLAAPASAATMTPDYGVVLDDGFAYPFQVTANDGVSDPGGLDYVVVSGAAVDAGWVYADATTVYVDPSAVTSPPTGVLDIPYTLHDGTDDSVIGSSTLHVAVVPDSLRLVGGNGQVTVHWPGLPSGADGIDGLRVSHSTSVLHAHDGSVVTSPGTGDVVVGGLTNGTLYHFYVTPSYHGVDLQGGPEPSSAPRSAVDQPPVAKDDYVSVVASTTGGVYVYPLLNDTDADGDDLAVVGHSSPAHGTLSCNPDHCFYQFAGAPQSDSATYTVDDGYGGTATGTIHVVLRTGVTANPDTASTYVDESTTTHPLANDTLTLPGDRVLLGQVPSSVNAFVTDQGTGVEITGVSPDPSAVIPYSIVDDQYDVLASSTITVAVGAKRPLVAHEDQRSTDLDLESDLFVGRNDFVSADSIPLDNTGTKILTGPAHGTASLDLVPQEYDGPNEALLGQTLNLPVIHYTPATGYLGDDTITYQLKDAQGRTDTATATVHVGIPQVAFVAAAPGVSQSQVTWSLSASPAVDQVRLCYRVGTDRTTIPATPARTCDGPNDHLAALPSGQPTSTLLTGLTNDRWHTVAVWIHSHDGTQDGVWSEAAQTSTRPGVGSVSNVYADGGNGGKITLTWTNPNGARASTGTAVRYSTGTSPTTPTDGTGGTTVGAGATSATLTGLADDTSYHLAVFATDDGHGSWGDPVPVTVTVKNTDTPPVGVADAATLDENSYQTIRPLTNDTDANGDVLDLKSWTQPAHGSVTCDPGSGVQGDPWECTYVPTHNFFGSDSFTYVVGDHHFGTATGTVALTVNQVNQAPQAGDDTLTATAGHATPVPLSLDAFDPDGNDLTYAVVTDPAHGTISCTATTGACTYTATQGYTGSDSFTWKVTDDGKTGGNPDPKTSRTATMSITVVANQSPTVQDRTASAHPGTQVVVDVSSGAHDPDGDPLTFSVLTQPNKGAVACTGAGSCTYHAAADATGQDSFQFQVSDGHGGSATGSVVVTITNHAPVAADATFTTDNATPYVANLASLSSDLDGDTLTFSKVSGPSPAAAGTVACGGTTCTYTPAAGYTGAVSFVYQANDGFGGTDTGTVSGTVTQAGGGTSTATLQRAGAASRSVKSAVSFTGTASPVRPGAGVQLQRLTGATWSTIASTTESASGGYSFSLTQPTGTWSYRVLVPGDGTVPDATSPTVPAAFYAVSMPASSTSGDEFVTIKNTGTVAVNLKGWTVITKAHKVLTLPSYALKPGTSVKVHTGKGRPNATNLYLNKPNSFAAHDKLVLKDLAKVSVAARSF